MVAYLNIAILACLTNTKLSLYICIVPFYISVQSCLNLTKGMRSLQNINQGKLCKGGKEGKFTLYFLLNYLRAPSDAYIISASKLGKAERPFLLNIASSLKGKLVINLWITMVSRAALPKVKAILLEVYLIGALLMRPNLARDWISKIELELDNWVLAKGQFNRGAIHTHNLRKGLPKGITNGIFLGTSGLSKAYHEVMELWQRRDHTTRTLAYLLFVRR